MVERLFEIVEQRSMKSPDSIMLAAKENGQWRTYSSAEAPVLLMLME